MLVRGKNVARQTETINVVALERFAGKSNVMPSKMVTRKLNVVISKQARER